MPRNRGKLVALVGAAAVVCVGCAVLGIMANVFGLGRESPPTDEAVAAAQPVEPAAPVSPTDTPEPEPTPAPESPPVGETQDFASPPSPPVEPVPLSGTGQQAAGPVSLVPGLVVAEMSHNGQANFAVKVLDDQGQMVELLANDIGPFGGAKAFRSEGGEYLLDVTADGDWTITVSQPAIDSLAATLPVTLEGAGPGVKFVALDGLTKFIMSHDGEANFAVIVLDRGGNKVDLLANEIGKFDGSKAAGLPAGDYVLNVEADGSWVISIE